MLSVDSHRELTQLLVAGPRRNRNHIKRRLFEAGLKARLCESCGLSEWRDVAIPLALHHVNGDRHDNRLALGMLTRADKKAEAYREDERLVAAVAEQFEELLDIIEAEGDADYFIDCHRPAAEEYRPEACRPAPDEE